MEPEGPDVPKREGDSNPRDTRRRALLGLVIILLLVVGGLVLIHVLRGMSQLQDCALSGRSNCT